MNCYSLIDHYQLDNCMKQILFYLFLLSLTLIPLSIQAQTEEEKSNKFPLSFLGEFGIGLSYIDYYQSSYSSDETAVNIYSNLGFMYKVNQKWGLGMHGNISLHPTAKGETTYGGIRLRYSRYFNNGHEWNISPGIRRTFNGSSFSTYGIETTYSWNKHMGVMANIESSQGTNDIQSLTTIGLFIKGKKAIVTSLVSILAAVATIAAAIHSSN